MDIAAINRNSKDQVGRARERTRTFLDSLPGTSKIQGVECSGDDQPIKIFVSRHRYIQNLGK